MCLVFLVKCRFSTTIIQYSERFFVLMMLILENPKDKNIIIETFLGSRFFNTSESPPKVPELTVHQRTPGV